VSRVYVFGLRIIVAESFECSRFASDANRDFSKIIMLLKISNDQYFTIWLNWNKILKTKLPLQSWYFVDLFYSYSDTDNHLTLIDGL